MNENEVQVWNYEGAEVRTVQIDGEPWFVLADICRELEISNSRMVSERLESDWSTVSCSVSIYLIGDSCTSLD